MDKYPAEYFVETGTSGGNAVAHASKKDYKGIRTVELDEELREVHAKRKLNKVEFYYGDSREKLAEMIADIDGKIFFFLDAHTSPNIELRKQFGNLPILEELEVIKQHPRKDHTIVIDDLTTFGQPVFNDVTEDDLKTQLLSINSDYKFKVEGNHGEVLVAYV